MSDRYRLGGIGNDALLAALSRLVTRENDLRSDLLACLAELDERRLYLDFGFASLFAYCTEALGLCKSSAGRRIAAARVCRRYPEAFGRVASGELQLSVLSLLGPHLDAENAAELFEACARKTCDQVEEILAASFPKPDVRDLVRRLPPRSAIAPAGGSALEAEPFANADVSSDSGRRSTPQPIPAQRKLEPLSPDRFGVHFTADAEFRELLEEVRDLASHCEPGGNLLSLMKHGLEAYRRELQKQRFGVGRKPQRKVSTGVLRKGDSAKSEQRREAREPRQASQARRASGESDTNEVPEQSDTSDASELRQANDAREALKPQTCHARSRHVPAAVARVVYLRDGRRCTFCSKDGRRCGARRFLQLDHVRPWAAEGVSTVENLRLRCRAHNLHSAWRYFGADFMRRKLGHSHAGEVER